MKPGWSKAFGLPETLEAKFKTFDGLAKSYGNLEKMLGTQGKVAIPNEHSTPEEKEAFFAKLGRPAKPEEYKIEKPEALKDIGLDEKALGEVRTLAHGLGLTQQQLGPLTDWYFKQVGGSLEAVQAQQVAAKEAAVGELKKEWGAEYDANLKAAERGAAIAGLSLDVLKATPELSNNPHFIRAMVKVAQMTKENPGAGMRNQPGSMGANTPEAARAEIAKIRADKNHPYNNTQANPKDREAAVAEMGRLYAIVNPEPAGGR